MPVNLDKAREALQQRLGHEFAEKELLYRALTHSSTGAARNYERLEFLGDRVVGLAIAHALWTLFPKDSEGDLAKRHAALVQGKMLARIAREVDLGRSMQLSSAERAAGGAENDNILSDGLESVIGAIYVDGGFAAAVKVIEHLWGDSVHTMKRPPQDPKTALQEWAQARGLPLPEYELAGKSGPDHAPAFVIKVSVAGYPPATAKGSSRRRAEKDAAGTLLAHLREMDS